jgi:hypothetical protein
MSIQTQFPVVLGLVAFGDAGSDYPSPSDHHTVEARRPGRVSTVVAEYVLADRDRALDIKKRPRELPRGGRWDGGGNRLQISPTDVPKLHRFK